LSEDVWVTKIAKPKPEYVRHEWYETERALVHRATLTIELLSDHDLRFPNELKKHAEDSIAEELCKIVINAQYEE
jgi:hypothetical protein